MFLTMLALDSGGLLLEASLLMAGVIPLLDLLLTADIAEYILLFTSDEVQLKVIGIFSRKASTCWTNLLFGVFAH